MFSFYDMKPATATPSFPQIFSRHVQLGTYIKFDPPKMMRKILLVLLLGLSALMGTSAGEMPYIFGMHSMHVG